MYVHFASSLKKKIARGRVCLAREAAKKVILIGGYMAGLKKKFLRPNGTAGPLKKLFFSAPPSYRV